MWITASDFPIDVWQFFLKNVEVLLNIQDFADELAIFVINVNWFGSCFEGV